MTDSGGVKWPRVVFGFGHDTNAEYAAGNFIEADVIEIHPFQDMALARLVELPRDEVGELIAPVELYDGPALAVNQILLIAGSGRTGSPGQAGGSTAGVSDGFTRAVEVRYYRMSSLEPSLGGAAYDGSLDLSGVFGGGDSGGLTAFVEEGTGRILQVGVNDSVIGSGTNTDSRFELIVYQQEVFNNFNWIEDTIADNLPDGSEGEGEGEGEGSEGEGEGEEPTHSADTDGDGMVSLSELLRVIQLFNTGGYHCADALDLTEDDYFPGADPSKQACTAHTADYAPQDWSLSLSELLRSIQFFNTAGYYACPEGEDGYCAGAATP